MKHYEDNFAHDHLPHASLQAECFTGHPDFEFPEDLNCVERLLDRHITEAHLRPHGHINNYMKKPTR